MVRKKMSFWEEVEDFLSQAPLTDHRRQRILAYKESLLPFAVGIYNVHKARNAAGLIRTAHVSRAREFIVVGERDWTSAETRTADQWTDIKIIRELDQFLDYVKERGYRLVSVEKNERSVSLFEIERYPTPPLIFLGTELGGIPEEILAASDLVVHIPGGGLVPWLNVSVAGGIVVFDFLQKHKDDPAYDLSRELPAPGVRHGFLEFRHKSELRRRQREKASSQDG